MDLIEFRYEYFYYSFELSKKLMALSIISNHMKRNPIPGITRNVFVLH